MSRGMWQVMLKMMLKMLKLCSQYWGTGTWSRSSTKLLITGSEISKHSHLPSFLHSSMVWFWLNLINICMDVSVSVLRRFLKGLLQFPPISPKHPAWWIVYVKLPLGVKVYVHIALKWTSNTIQSRPHSRYQYPLGTRPFFLHQAPWLRWAKAANEIKR